MTIRTTTIKQKGMVSIVVTLVMMIVLSLIVISFSQIMRREQRQSLDKQLETQAFYAAESGVNAAIKLLQTQIAAGTLTSYTTCGTFPVASAPTLDPTTNSAVTCILVNTSPTTLTYSPVPVNTAQVIPINTAAPINYIEVAWQDPNAPAGATFPPVSAITPTFPSVGSWSSTGAGVLRIDLVPVTGANTLGPGGNLYTQNQVFFLYPMTSLLANVSTSVVAAPGLLNIADSSKGGITSITCNTGSLPNYCLAHIPIQGAYWAASTSFYMRIVPIYSSASVTITAYSTAATPAPLALSGAQAIVDSTGRGADVLKRISVHVPLKPKAVSAIPNVYAIDVGTSLCKLLSVSPTNPPIDNCP